jgi:hypothetical protein
MNQLDAFLEDDLLRRMLERLPGEPTPMRQRPMTAPRSGSGRDAAGTKAAAGVCLDGQIKLWLVEEQKLLAALLIGKRLKNPDNALVDSASCPCACPSGWLV